MEVIDTFLSTVSKEEAKKYFPLLDTLYEDSADTVELLNNFRNSGKLENPLHAYPILVHWSMWHSTMQQLKNATNLK